MKDGNVCEPLLYVKQPVLKRPVAYMQSSYHGTQLTKESKVNGKSVKQKGDKSREREDVDFNKYTINEKIHYLVNLPLEMPSIKCEVTTDVGTYRGIIDKDLDNEIVIRIFGRENQTIQKDDINHINMIGF